MPDLYMVVDTALAEVPVNLLPLLDDTDFKSREVAIVYNQAGMDLVWNFLTTAGAYTQTAVTPTTSGTYDWAHQGDGMYSIEIPASGGASINNDTEGFGWFTGFATGVLPWRGPVIQFSPANVVNSLVEGSDKLQVHADEITAGLITAAAIADNAIDAGAIAADAITNAKIADGAISAGKLANDTITAAKIAADAITDAKVASDVTIASVTGSVGSIGNGGITSSSFGSGAITAAAIAADAITDAKVASDVTIASVTGAVGSVTGNIGGNVAGSVGSVTSVSDKTGYRLSSTGVDDVLDEVVEGSITFRQMLRLFGAALGGELSGAATTTITIRNASDSKAVITATVDADGNRSVVVLDLT